MFTRARVVNIEIVQEIIEERRHRRRGPAQNGAAVC
jgi:hypothetical protein